MSDPPYIIATWIRLFQAGLALAGLLFWIYWSDGSKRYHRYALMAILWLSHGLVYFLASAYNGYYGGLLTILQFFFWRSTLIFHALTSLVGLGAILVVEKWRENAK
jgi:hypothetical protein